MCNWRRVTNYYKKCGHSESLPEEHVSCVSPRCKFSPTHPIDCLPPYCSRTCWQYHQYPEQYSPLLDRFCTKCTAKHEAKMRTFARR